MDNSGVSKGKKEKKKQKEGEKLKAQPENEVDFFSLQIIKDPFYKRLFLPKKSFEIQTLAKFKNFDSPIPDHILNQQKSGIVRNISEIYLQDYSILNWVDRKYQNPTLSNSKKKKAFPINRNKLLNYEIDQEKTQSILGSNISLVWYFLNSATQENPQEDPNNNPEQKQDQGKKKLKGDKKNGKECVVDNKLKKQERVINKNEKKTDSKKYLAVDPKIKNGKNNIKDEKSESPSEIKKNLSTDILESFKKLNETPRQVTQEEKELIKTNSINVKVLQTDIKNELLNNRSEELIENNKSVREEYSIPLFHLLNKIKHDNLYFDNRQNKPLFMQTKVRKIIFQPMSLTTTIGDLEPFFCSACLYDWKKKKKISENYYFELNSWGFPDWVEYKNKQKMANKISLFTKVEKAIFTIINPTPSIILFIRIEKICQGGYDQIIQPYLKSGTNFNSTEIRKKFRSNLSNSLKKFGYSKKQSFACSIIKLFDSKLNLIHTKFKGYDHSQIIKSKGLNSNKQLFNLINLEFNIDEFPKQKTIPGHFCYLILDSNDDNGNNDEYEDNDNYNYNYNDKKENEEVIIDPSFRKERIKKNKNNNKEFDLKHKKKINSDSNLDVCSNTDNDTGMDTDTDTDTDITTGIDIDININIDTKTNTKINTNTNKNTNINKNTNTNKNKNKNTNTNKNTNEKNRNFYIKIEYKNEDNLKKKGIDLIYGRRSETKFLNKFYTSLFLNEKNPKFYNEIKICLPGILNERAHLLFSIYNHKSIKDKGNEGTNKKRAIGYSILPINQEILLNNNQKFNLNIFPTLAKMDYYDKFLCLNENINIKNKPRLKITIDLISTVYPKNDYLHELFNNYIQLEKNPQIDRRFLKSLNYLIQNENDDDDDYYYYNHSKNKSNNVDNYRDRNDYHNIKNINNKIPINIQICYFNLILEIFYKTLVSGNAMIKIKTFIIFLKFLNNLYQKRKYIYKLILKPYIDNIFNFYENENSDYFFEEIVNLWNRTLLKEKLSQNKKKKRNHSIANDDNEMKNGNIRERGKESEMGKKKNKIIYKSYTVRSCKFLFALITKSLTVYINKNIKNYTSKQFNIFFKKIFLDELFILIDFFRLQIELNSNNSIKFTKYLNKSLAFFLKDLLFIVNPTNVFLIIKNYFKNLHFPNQSLIVLTELKYQFLQIIIDNENYLILNKPFLYDISQNKNIFKFLCKKHFFVGLIIKDLKRTFKNFENEEIQPFLKIIFKLIMNLLIKHEIDNKYFKNNDNGNGNNGNDNDNSKLKSQIISIKYINLENKKNEFDFKDDLNKKKIIEVNNNNNLTSKDNNSNNDNVNVNNRNKNDNSNNNISSSGSSFNNNNGNGNGNVNIVNNGEEGEEGEETVIKEDKNISLPINSDINRIDRINRIKKIKKITKLSKNNLLKSGSTGSLIEKKTPNKLKHKSINKNISDNNSVNNRSKNKTIKRNSLKNLSPIPIKKILKLTNISPLKINKKRYKLYNLETERQLSIQINLIIISILEDMLIKLEPNLHKDNILGEKTNFQKIFELFILILNKNNSYLIINYLLKSLIFLIDNFPNKIFLQENNLLGELCRSIFPKILYHNKQTRSLANTFLFYLISKNYEMTKDLSKIQIQLSTALNTFVDNLNKKYQRNELVFFKKFFAIITNLSKSPKYNFQNNSNSNNNSLFKNNAKNKNNNNNDDNDNLSSNLNKKKKTILEKKIFLKQIDQLIGHLLGILLDSLKVYDYKSDPEMHADLLLRIANGYKKTPSIRFDWLTKLEMLMLKQNNYGEAAVIMIHKCAMISEYLKIISPNSKWLPQNGALAFIDIVPSVVEECYLSGGNLNCDEKRDRDSNSNSTRHKRGEFLPDFNFIDPQYFSIQGLIDCLQVAIKYLRKCNWIEMSSDVYEILLKIYKYKKDFRKISQSFIYLRNDYDLLIKEMFDFPRTFGHYYRVAFFGERFGENNIVEFVYKCKPEILIFDLKPMLKKTFSQIIGIKKIIFLESLKNVEVNKFDQNNCYILLTSVKPYFTEKESKNRVTTFEKMNKVNKFYYENYYSLSGDKKMSENVDDCCRLKTILTTEHYFPYMKTRSKVIKKEIIDLSPIQVAIEDIKKKTMQFEMELNKIDIRMNNLQSLLMGTLLTQVNVGPLEYANVFLKNPQKFTESGIKNLQISFIRFLICLRTALDQHSFKLGYLHNELQDKLEEGFQKFNQIVNQSDILINKIYPNLIVDEDLEEN
ncbi:dedicator of cytokinesis dock [Anaeramoeba flamelloides]|uniref:Dedicator of cytokinesis dock n=1 Tax=Anaeramoeba flamelloides TaxID=1746091 RepID=A0AAV7YAP7_9EUKA|nr:dedicator of cytokinesis dock [Anaeramoeba flamelloides]